MVSCDLGQRPSSLLGWVDEEDWIGRLFFDLEMVSKYHEAELKAQEKAVKKNKKGR